MDPSDPSSFTLTQATLSTGRTYRYADQVPGNYNPSTSVTILCVHGFPDFWYGWRYLIPPWVNAGHRVLAPDMLGYGGTDKPFDVSEYSTKKLSADLAALLDHSGVKAGDPVIVVGHDWGSFVAQRFALWHPDRLKGLVILSVAYTPPSPVYLPIEKVVELAPNLKYQAYFNSQESTKDLDANVSRVVRVLYGSLPDPSVAPQDSSVSMKDLLTGVTSIDWLDCLLSDKDAKIYEEMLSKGMNGPLNYYRTHKYRHDEEQDHISVIFIYGSWDLTVVLTAAEKAKKFIQNLETVKVNDVAHWVTINPKARKIVEDKVLQLASDVLKRSYLGKL